MQRAGVRVRGAYVVSVLVLAVLATAVVPPAGAWWLNGRRVQDSQDRAAAVAARLAPGLPSPVLCGPGRDVPTDAWDNCFFVSETWVISAGPNGVLETALDAAAPAGDDVGVRRR